jgi:PKD repeat protein
VTHSYSSSSIYNVSLTVTDSASPFPHRKTVTQLPNIFPLLTATLTYSPPSPHVDQAVTFSGFGDGGVPPYIYSWTFGDSATGSGVSVTHIYASPGTYAVVLTVRDSASSSSETHNVTKSVVVLAAGSPITYLLSWQGYDWDGGNEETILINGRLVGSLPATDSPQNGGVYVPFSLNITSFVVKGTNSLTFYHASWDCSVSDNVRNLQVTAGTTVLYSNATVYPLGCGQPLVYTFTI